MKQKVTQQQFDLIKALHTGQRIKPGSTPEIVEGMPVFEIEKYDPTQELLQRYEIVENQNEGR